MAQDHMVFRGVFPNHTLFKNCVDTWTQAQGFPLSSRYVKFAEAMGVGSHVIQRVIYGDTDSRKAGETLRLSIPLAQKAGGPPGAAPWHLRRSGAFGVPPGGPAAGPGGPSSAPRPRGPHRHPVQGPHRPRGHGC